MWSRRTFQCGIIACALGIVFGHYVGEPLKTTILSSRGKFEATKAQWPLFGVDSSVKLPRSNERFSLGFEESYHQLSWIDTNNLGKLKITFFFSRSSDGIITSVFSHPVMKTIDEEYSTHHFDVEYRWEEEQPVFISSGCALMFLSTLVVSLYMAFAICACSDDSLADSEEDSDHDLLRRRTDFVQHND